MCSSDLADIHVDEFKLQLPIGLRCRSKHAEAGGVDQDVAKKAMLRQGVLQLAAGIFADKIEQHLVRLRTSLAQSRCEFGETFLRSIHQNDDGPVARRTAGKLPANA